MSRQPIQRRREPAFIEPMQCKPVTALPSGDKWIFEIKFDGYRCIAVRREREVTLFSRHNKVLNRRFPSVVEALELFEGNFTLDGELVALDSQVTFISTPARQSLTVDSDLFLRIRFTEPKWRAAFGSDTSPRRRESLEPASRATRFAQIRTRCVGPCFEP